MTRHQDKALPQPRLADQRVATDRKAGDEEQPGTRNGKGKSPLDPDSTLPTPCLVGKSRTASGLWEVGVWGASLGL